MGAGYLVSSGVSSCQIIGARDAQEDCFANFSFAEEESEVVEPFLAVVADGMGGEDYGALASNLALEVFIRDCFTKTALPTKEMMASALEVANHAVLESQFNGCMGTTLLSVHINKSVAHWLSVGDSLLYLLRSGALTQLNEDHSMMPILKEMEENGELEIGSAVKHPDRNALRSAITGEHIELIDQGQIHLLPGDTLILATDGLLSLSQKEVSSSVSSSIAYNHDPAKSLIYEVQEKKLPQQDNTTVTVINIS